MHAIMRQSAYVTLTQMDVLRARENTVKPWMVRWLSEPSSSVLVHGNHAWESAT